METFCFSSSECPFDVRIEIVQGMSIAISRQQSHNFGIDSLHGPTRQLLSNFATRHLDNTTVMFNECPFSHLRTGLTQVVLPHLNLSSQIFAPIENREQQFTLLSRTAYLSWSPRL
jgi:hypothetical protein